MNRSAETAVLLRPEQVAKALNVSQKALEARRRRGVGPPFVRLSATCVRYPEDELEAWLRDLPRGRG